LRPGEGDSSASSFKPDDLASVDFASSSVDAVATDSVLTVPGFGFSASSSSPVETLVVDADDVDGFESEGFESADEDLEESDWPSSAEAMAAPLAIATPIPRATANPPTLPMNLP
jgi:hypothetical protein